MKSKRAVIDENQPFDEDEQFETLIESMRRVRPLALVGAGASVDSGYPTWGQLLKELEEEALRKRGVVAPKHMSLIKDLTDPAWQAEEFFNLLGEKAFNDYIRRTFGPRTVEEPHHLISRVGFRHILTTNFEPCAEEALLAATNKRPKRVDWSNVAQVQDFFADLAHAQSDPSVVYLHGFAEEPANIVLTEKSYTRAYLREENKRRLIALFMTQPVVFIGFSMNDPDLSQIMREVLFCLPDHPEETAIASDKPVLRRMRHFGLFGYRTLAERDLIRTRMQGKFGLQTVFYRIRTLEDGKTHSHEYLLDLLEAIASAVRQPGGLLAYPGKAPSTRAPKSNSANASNSAVTFDGGLFDIDPNKGKFGGSAERGGYILHATNIRERSQWVRFDLVVRGQGRKKLTAPVTFHFHPTFEEEEETIEPAKGRARTTVNAVGAFTVGVEVDGTKLELDLSNDDRFPIWFRQS
ncbi:SIR2 family protein (plasmid) [Rhizobium leguminosarum]